MVFLFVGSSALTEASFPRDLAIPQLLLSSACAIVLTMKASATAVFPHRGLAPHQFAPMSGAHQALDRMTRSAVSRVFHCVRPWRAPRHRSAALGHFTMRKYFGRLFGAIARGRSQHLLDIAR